MWKIFLLLSYIPPIFSIKTKKDRKSFGITFAGDTTFSGYVYYLKKIGNCTYKESFNKITNVINTEFFVLNFETTVGNASNPPPKLNTKKPVQLISEVESLEALSYLKVNAVTIANNHLLDYGETGVVETVRALGQYIIAVSGLSYGKKRLSEQNPIIFIRNGVRVGILSYCFVEDGCIKERSKTFMGPAMYKKSDALEDLVNLKKQCDSIVVYFHWGEEYAVIQSIEKVKDIIQTIQVYADVIIGSHGHVLAGHFFYNNTLIVENLGNFLYPMYQTKHQFILWNVGNKSQNAKETAEMMRNHPNPTTESMILSLSFNKNGLDRKKSKYLQLKIKVNERGCLYVDKRKKDEKWISFCTSKDRKCQGDNECNVFKCSKEKRKKKNSRLLSKETQTVSD